MKQRSSPEFEMFATAPEANRGGKKCYNFRLAMPFQGAAYCMSQGQPTLLLVVHRDSQVICAAVHMYSHLIETSTPLTAMIQLKPGIPPASLKGPREPA